jgi:hypothetical protein
MWRSARSATPLLVAAAALGLMSCAGSHSRIVTREVRIPITAPCTPTLPPKPNYAADVAPLDGSIFDLVRSLLIDREQRKSQELALRAALAGCGAT